MLPFLLPRYINDRSILLPPSGILYKDSLVIHKRTAILEPWIGFSFFFIFSICRIIVVVYCLNLYLLLVAVAANESTIFVGNQ